MKLKKIFLALAVVFAIGSSAVAVDAAVKGDNTTAVKFTLVAFTALVSQTEALSGVLGFMGGSKGMATLERNWQKFGSKSKEQLQNIEAVDYTLYVRREITSKSGVYRLIEADNVKTKGITNIDKNRLPEGDNLAIERIGLFEGNHASVTNPAAIANYTNLSTSVQAELRNAELVITQDTKEKLRVPVSSLLVMAVNSNGAKKDVAYELDNPVFLAENLPFEINLEFPATMAAASSSTNKFHVEVELYCKKTQKRYA